MQKSYVTQYVTHTMKREGNIISEIMRGVRRGGRASLFRKIRILTLRQKIRTLAAEQKDAMAALALESDERKIARIAVLGAGWWAQGWHLPQLKRHPGAVIVAIVDSNAAPRSAIAALEPLDALAIAYGCAVFSTLDALLASDLELDGILVCTSHASRSPRVGG